MDKKKILFFQQGTIFGGAETQLLTLCKYLSAMHDSLFELHVATNEPSFQTHEHFRELQKYAAVHYAEDIPALAELMGAITPDLVHHFHNDWVSQAMDLADLTCPAVEVVHGCLHFPNDVTTTPKHHTTHVVAVSNDAKRFFLESRPDFSNWVSVIPNGIELDRFKPREGARKPGPLRFLHVGRLCEGDKKITKIIKALKVLPAGSWELHLVGTGSDYENIFRYAAINAPGAVKFYGYRTHPEKIYPEMDVYVSRSESEGWGLSIAEAMACGLPVVMWDCGGIAEYMVDQQHALITTRESEFTGAIDAVARYEATRECLSLAARTFSEDVLDAKVMAGRYADLYTNLINRTEIPVRLAQIKKPVSAKRLLGISNPNFTGVTQATKAWVGAENWVAAPSTQEGMNKLAQDIAFNLSYSKPQIIILGGDAGFLPFVRRLRELKYRGRILLTWHSTLSFFSFSPQDGDLLADWVQALRDGLIDRIGFVRNGLHPVFKDPRVIVFPNRIPLARKGKFSPVPLKRPATHIGIFGTGHAWKNMDALVYGASLVENSIIHVNHFSGLPLAKKLGVNIVTHEQLPHEKFLQLLGSMDCNLQGSFTESFGLTFCESYREGVPCLATPNVKPVSKADIFFCIADHDRPTHIAAQIEGAIRHKAECVSEMNFILDEESELHDRIIEEALAAL